MADKTPPKKGRPRGSGSFPWRAFFQHSTTPVFVLGKGRRLRFANPAWEKLTGVKLADALGMVCSARQAQHAARGRAGADARGRGRQAGQVAPRRAARGTARSGGTSPSRRWPATMGFTASSGSSRSSANRRRTRRASSPQVSLHFASSTRHTSRSIFSPELRPRASGS